MMEKVGYLNIDLLITSKEKLTPIIEQFGEDVVVLYDGEWGSHYRASFEIAGSHAAANEDILYFCSLIKGLTGEAKIQWENALSKEFDIGFESGAAPESYSTDIKSQVVAAVAAAGASLTITIYPIGLARKYT